jgi:hypothetical protein
MASNQEATMPRAHWHAKNWGGRRPGAGRPVQGVQTRSISITLPEDIIQAIDAQAYRHQMTRSAVIALYLAPVMEK